VASVCCAAKGSEAVRLAAVLASTEPDARPPPADTLDDCDEEHLRPNTRHGHSYRQTLLLVVVVVVGHYDEFVEDEQTDAQHRCERDMERCFALELRKSQHNTDMLGVPKAVPCRALACTDANSPEFSTLQTVTFIEMLVQSTVLFRNFIEVYRMEGQ
jgi:hypothetical protein